MAKSVHPAVSAHFSKIGSKGGSATTDDKAAASAANLEKARAQRWKQRLLNVPDSAKTTKSLSGGAPGPDFKPPRPKRSRTLLNPAVAGNVTKLVRKG